MRVPRPRTALARLLNRSEPAVPAVAAPDRGPLDSPDALRVEPDPAVDNPVLTARDVDDVRHVQFVADPFVVREEEYHLFFEVKRADRHRLAGLRDVAWRFDVGHATSEDGREWQYQGVVLPHEQAAHTYPHVFRHAGEWLMAPAPAGDTPREFRLYRAESFPADWSLAHRALDGEVRIDPTPFVYDGTWYLVYQEQGTFDVRLRYADDLFADAWHEHPASPLFSPGGNDVAPGGRPLVREGHVDIFFRRGDPGVVEAWRAVELTPERLDLRELPTSPVLAGVGGRGWNARNMHHVDAGLTEQGEDLVLVDGQDAARDYRIGCYRARGGS